MGPLGELSWAQQTGNMDFSPVSRRAGVEAEKEHLVHINLCDFPKLRRLDDPIEGIQVTACSQRAALGSR